jgi:hypothetical protein
VISVATTIATVAAIAIVIVFTFISAVVILLIITYKSWRALIPKAQSIILPQTELLCACRIYQSKLATFQLPM